MKNIVLLLTLSLCATAQAQHTVTVGPEQQYTYRRITVTRPCWLWPGCYRVRTIWVGSPAGSPPPAMPGLAPPTVEYGAPSG